MGRLQLALNVSDIDAAVDFYTKVFGVGPHKRQPGYANFAVADPPLKLVLFEGAGEPGSLNHLGVEVDSTDDVAAATQRFRSAGLETLVEDASTCCYATQDKVWVQGPDAQRWEFYTVLADSETFFAPESETSDCACEAPAASSATS